MLADLRAVHDLEELRRPLNAEVIQDICFKFEIPASDPRGQPNAVVYSDGFNKTIVDALKTTKQRQMTFEQVEEKLGKYRYNRGVIFTQADGTQYFACEYDLQGDKIFTIRIAFFSDGRVWRIYSNHLPS